MYRRLVSASKEELNAMVHRHRKRRSEFIVAGFDSLEIGKTDVGAVDMIE